MAPKQKPQGSQSYQQKQWVVYDLDKKEQALVKAWKPTFEEFDEQLVKSMGEVYKCAVSFDARAKCWLVVMQTKYDEGPHKNMLLSARGSTPLKAFKRLVYTHLELFREKWPHDPDYTQYPVIDD